MSQDPKYSSCTSRQIIPLCLAIPLKAWWPDKSRNSYFNPTYNKIFHSIFLASSKSSLWNLLTYYAIYSTKLKSCHGIVERQNHLTPNYWRCYVLVAVIVIYFSLKGNSQKILSRLLAQIQFHKAGLFISIMKLWLQDGWNIRQHFNNSMDKDPWL